MSLYLLKLFLSATLIVAVTELSKRANTFWAGLLASLPLVSLLSFFWLYIETRDSERIAALSSTIFWLLLPSLSLFLTLPWLLRRPLPFPTALALALALMAALYAATAWLLRALSLKP